MSHGRGARGRSALRRAAAVGSVAILLLTGCSGGTADESTATTLASTASVDAGPSPSEVRDAVASTTESGTTVPEGVVFGLDTPAAPASIDITLDEPAAASTVIGRSGGSISAVGADGAEFTLSIPPAALISDTEITMTPIAAATGAAMGDHFVAGVDLQPDGLHFLGEATLEVRAPGVEDALGWGTENGGNDLHLEFSEPGDGVVSIPVIHFSEFGLAERQIEDLLASEGVVSAGTDARLAWLLARASDEIAIGVAIDTLEYLSVGSFTPADPAEDYATFERLSRDVVTHLFRVAAVARLRGWGPDTPRYDELTEAYRDAIVGWLDAGDVIVGEQNELCADGHIEGAFRTLRQAFIGIYAIGIRSQVGGEDADGQTDLIASYLYPWADAGLACLTLGLTWQARIVTTGAGFRSDISIGAEAVAGLGDDYDSVEWLLSRGDQAGPDDFVFELPEIPIETDLEIEWVEGFFADPILNCTPGNGRLEMEYYDFDAYIPNLGDIGEVVIESTPFWVRVKVLEPITLGCNPAYNIGGDAARPFHLGALEYLNGPFSVNGYWDFAMIYEPGDGEVARFEQGFPVDGQGVIVDAPSLDFGDGRYELWQLVTVFQD